MINLVLNRRARNLAGNGPIRRALLAAARETGVCAHETTSLEQLEVVARTIAARAAGGSSRVILAGGDGSYMAGVTALARAFGDGALPPLAFAPGGTVGTVARNWCRTGRKGWGAREAEAIVRAAAAEGAGPSAQAHAPRCASPMTAGAIASDSSSARGSSRASSTSTTRRRRPGTSRLRASWRACSRSRSWVASSRGACWTRSPRS